MVEHKSDASIYTLTLICILAIVATVFFVNQYLQSNPAYTSTLSNVGQAYGVLQQDTQSSGIVTYTETDPGQTYAYLRK